jgi:uncharacterized protein YqhQ
VSVSLRDRIRLLAHIQLLPVLESGEETLVGGQAVMEGVMMRAPHSYCVSVRKASGEVVSDTLSIPKFSDQYPIFRFPVIRGVGTMYQAMKLGFRALRFSADVAIAEDAAAQGKAAESKEPSGEVSSWAMAGNLLVSLAFFVFLYKFVPLFLATRLKAVYPIFEGRIAFNVADGVIRMAIFLAFLYGISLMKDIRRVFEYHGAEHKVVFNFESGQPLTIANAQRFTTYHPRCGTSFLLVVMIVSIAVYALIPFDGFLAKLVSRIALLPVVAGVSYEFIRFAARRRGSVLATLTAPGLWLQRITTKPPADDQTAVAIHALEGAMAIEKAQGGELVIA